MLWGARGRGGIWKAGLVGVSMFFRRSRSPKEARGERSFRERPAAPYSGPAWRGRELASGAEVAENLFFFVASDFNPSMSELVLCLAPL